MSNTKKVSFEKTYTKMVIFFNVQNTLKYILDTFSYIYLYSKSLKAYMKMNSKLRIVVIFNARS